MAARKSWDVTHLSTKYPWLRVDAETIEEFRSPFQWVDAPRRAPRAHVHGRGSERECEAHERAADDSDSAAGSDSNDERDESARFSLSSTTQQSSGATSKGEAKQKCRHEQHRHAVQRSQQQPRRQHHTKHTRLPAALASTQRLQSPATVRDELRGERSLSAKRTIAIADAASESMLLCTLPETDALYQALVPPAKALRVTRAKHKQKNKPKQHNLLSLRYVPMPRYACASKR